MLRRLPMNHFLTKFWQNKLQMAEDVSSNTACAVRPCCLGAPCTALGWRGGLRVALWVIVICDEV